MYNLYLFRHTENPKAGHTVSHYNKEIENSDIATVQNSLNITGNNYSEN